MAGSGIAGKNSARTWGIRAGDGDGDGDGDDDGGGGGGEKTETQISSLPRFIQLPEQWKNLMKFGSELHPQP